MTNKKLLIAMVAVVAALTACKTTEANYRAAYEAAVAKQTTDTAIDSLTVAKIQQADLPRDLTVNGVTLPVRTMPIGYDEDGGSSRDVVRRYNVVVGHFRQLFNAKEMRKRLIADGYADAMVFHDRQPVYYVVVGSTDSPEEAHELIERVKSDSRIRLKSPLPWVLRPAHLAR